MIRLATALALIALASFAANNASVKAYEGTLTIPTYEPQGRETEPPLFANSTVTGLYPFTTYLAPFKPGGPEPRTYRAIFVENEYLKLTYIPEFGGRIFSLYDKLRNREVFYRNDVIKPSHYNPRNSWPQSGLELTGPHDLHMLTLHGEPFWANQIVRKGDGSVSLVLGELDPVYQMKVNLTATLHPGIAALEIGVFCYNPRPARMPQMLWINTAINATPKTRFIYPMTRTVGHTTADIADWPLYNGIDYSWDRNNKHMLGVFGIDIYDNFQGAYQFDRDYGIFRYADRRIVQGMKLWTFGYGPGAKNLERGYTDNAGPYVELQSGRHVWDGHYEWVAPHKVESWSEWWIPVAGTNGLTTLSRDIALNIDGASLAIAAVRELPGSKVQVRGRTGELLNVTADLTPARPFKTIIPSLDGLEITVSDRDEHHLLDYRRPETNPGRKEYTPFTRPLEQPRKSPDEMGAEELTLAAEFKLKELDISGASALLDRALKIDAGFSRAHLLLGIQRFTAGDYAAAEGHLVKTIERDPYCDEAYYYLAMTQFALGKSKEAERNLYYIWPNSAYFGEREYYLGRLSLIERDYTSAISHLERALSVNAQDLLARIALSVAYRERGDVAAALKQIEAIERIDPTSRPARAERMFLSNDGGAKSELARLMGGQSQEAIGVSIFYRDLRRWSEAVRILQLVQDRNADPWGTPPIYYYTLAYCQRRAGAASRAGESLKKAQAAARNVDRFPYREESEAPLREAVEQNPRDTVARFALACLLYYRGKSAEAIREWEASVAGNPSDFSARRALGLAYAEQGYPIDRSAGELERAIELNPAHVRTLNDLSSLYARAGRFDDQIALLQKALARSPQDDDLAEGLLAANIAKGRYEDAERIVATRQFAPRHRTYGLRDKYRVMRYALGAQAFNRGDYAEALKRFESALTPPVSLGADDFQFQPTPRIQYYIGRALEALGRAAEAKQAYQKSISGMETLSGDRDSWSSENFFMVFALRRLGRIEEAERLQRHFVEFARTEQNARSATRRAEARYLLGLAEKARGRVADALNLIQQAVDAQPDLLAARLELRGDVPDPLGRNP
jgi:tetratricopeptide (TPR) repeat protein